MDIKIKFFILFLSFLTFTEAQFPTCDLNTIEWFAHPHDCESYFICFHGVRNTFSCAPGMHFSPTELRCMPSEEARCHVNYLCPPVDDMNNPVFLPDPYDCGIYYLCSRGTPIRRECAPGLWWDINNQWCAGANDVVCDNRTVINPGVPGTTTTWSPPTGPNLMICSHTERLAINDRYLKSYCFVNETYQYDQAESLCRTNRMELFIIDDPNTQLQFSSSITNLMNSQPESDLWINGRVYDECENWYSFNPGARMLPNYIHWVQDRDFVGRHTGPCLSYTNRFSNHYLAMGVNCNMSFRVICQFGNI